VLRLLKIVEKDLLKRTCDQVTSETTAFNKDFTLRVAATNTSALLLLCLQGWIDTEQKKLGRGPPHVLNVPCAWQDKERGFRIVGNRLERSEPNKLGTTFKLPKKFYIKGENTTFYIDPQSNGAIVIKDFQKGKNLWLNPRTAEANIDQYEVRKEFDNFKRQLQAWCKQNTKRRLAERLLRVSTDL